MPDEAITYSPHQVEILLGLHEDHATDGRRHITVVDLLSWARDPGGDLTYYQAVIRDDPGQAWMARRGPLPPDGDLACLLYDFWRAMKRLRLSEQAVLALTVMGFSPEEIAQVMDGHEMHDRRAIESRRKRIARMLTGRERRDTEGKVLFDASGRPKYSGGIARRLAAAMNGGEL